MHDLLTTHASAPSDAMNDLLLEFASVDDVQAGEAPSLAASAPAEPHDDGSRWSSLHEMALIYLALTYTTGEERTADVETIQIILETWYPDASQARIARVINDATLVFIGQGREQILAVSVASLRRTMPRDQRIAVFSDLVDIALAEGGLLPNEASFIERLAREWDIEQDAP